MYCKPLVVVFVSFRKFLSSKCDAEVIGDVARVWNGCTRCGPVPIQWSTDESNGEKWATVTDCSDEDLIFLGRSLSCSFTSERIWRWHAVHVNDIDECWRDRSTINVLVVFGMLTTHNASVNDWRSDSCPEICTNCNCSYCQRFCEIYIHTSIVFDTI